jgi:hypothetical protein
MNGIKIDQGTPTKPGLYLWKPDGSETVNTVTVTLIPESHEYGLTWPEHLAGLFGRDISHYKGKFSKRLVVTDNGLQEAYL